VNGDKNAVILDLMPYARTVAESKIDRNNGEDSILDDAVQEGLMNALEKEVDNDTQLRYNIVRGINNYLRKHRETQRKGKMWQDSVNDLYGAEIWGDNPDFA
jgi:hypothetical protein